MAHWGSTNTDILSNETFDFICVVCKRKGNKRQADDYCVDCQDYFCLSCVKVHEDVPLLTNHRILGKGQFPLCSVSSHGLNERCDKHSHNRIDMYCQHHGVVGCGTCMAVDHRLCQEIFYISEYLKENSSKLLTKDIQKELNTVIQTLKEHLENLKITKKQLMDIKAATLAYIKKFREEINERLDEIEKCTIAEAEDKFQTLLHAKEEEIKMLETKTSNAIAVQQNLEISNSSSPQTFVNSKKVETIATKVAGIVKSSKSHASIIDFTPDPRLSSLLEEITVLGDFNTELSAQNERESSRNVKKNEDLYQVNGSKKYNVKVQSDKEQCNIVSACTLGDGTILLSDYKNEKLKRLHSTTYTVIDYLDLPGEPMQVCSINIQQAAVCLPEQLEVHFISLTDKMKLSNKITTDFKCFCLAYAGGNLFISDDTSSVYIYSLSGRKLKQCKGQELFSIILHLAVSQDGSKVYVCDVANGLITLDRNGNVVGGFNSLELSHTSGSCHAGRGSIFVCENTSQKVLQFRLNGELIGEVLKFDDEERGPHSVCNNQQMSNMIICRHFENEIEVFDFV